MPRSSPLNCAFSLATPSKNNAANNVGETCASCGRRSRSIIGRPSRTATPPRPAGVERQSDLDERTKGDLFRDVLKRSLDDRYSGKLSRASAVVMAISSSRLTERASPLILGFNPSSRQTMAETAGASRRGPSGPSEGGEHSQSHFSTRDASRLSQTPREASFPQCVLSALSGRRPR